MYVTVKINLISITVANVEEEQGEVGHLFSKVYQLTVVNFKLNCQMAQNHKFLSINLNIYNVLNVSNKL